MKSLKILALESSCDDTSVAILDMSLDMGLDMSLDRGEKAPSYPECVLAHDIHSQFSEHAAYGGVVPEIAARSHLEHLVPLVEKALSSADMTLEDVDAFAVTSGPGLLGGLLVATSYIQSLAMVLNKPVIGVNHLEGHALTAHLTNGAAFPYLLFLASGGHCQLVHVKALGDYDLLGATLDDAAGECFDKVAQMIGLSYPGGPAIEKYAQGGDAQKYPFTVPMKNGTLELSFSGLKTAVRTCIRTLSAEAPLSKAVQADICASFQKTVGEALAYKTKLALRHVKAERLVFAGGVAANKMLRGRLEDVCAKEGAAFIAPPLGLCTDNAVMIAYAGGLRLLHGESHRVGEISPRPRWPLDELRSPSYT